MSYRAAIVSENSLEISSKLKRRPLQCFFLESTKILKKRSTTKNKNLKNRISNFAIGKKSQIYFFLSKKVLLKVFIKKIFFAQWWKETHFRKFCNWKKILPSLKNDFYAFEKMKGVFNCVQVLVSDKSLQLNFS